MLHLQGIKGHQSQIQRLALLLEKGAVPQAMLFSGIDGIGKRRIAESFLTALFCTGNNPPCLACQACKQIMAGSFPDFIRIQPNERGSIPIGTEGKNEYGTIRWFTERLTRKSVSGTYAALIDGIDHATPEGQNALLKTIEEPAANTHIILITSNRSAILPTILSRCFEIKFLPLPEETLCRILMEKEPAQDEPKFLSQISGGSASLARALTNTELLDDILQLCEEISSFIRGTGEKALQLSAVQKSRNSDQLIDTAINLYRLNIRLLIHGHPPHNSIKGETHFERFLKGIYFDNVQMAAAIIKIFLALKKGRTYNLNLRNSLKGMLYALHGHHVGELHLLNQTPG